MKKFLSLCLLFSLPCLAEGFKIVHKNGQFFVSSRDKMTHVASYDVDASLRRMNGTQLKAYLDAGCSIRAHKLSNGDFRLQGHVPGKGGGPILAAITAASGAVTTAASAAVILVAGTIAGNPAESAGLAAATVTGGMALTAYATEAALLAPTP